MGAAESVTVQMEVSPLIVIDQFADLYRLFLLVVFDGFNVVGVFYVCEIFRIWWRTKWLQKVGSAIDFPNEMISNSRL